MNILRFIWFFLFFSWSALAFSQEAPILVKQALNQLEGQHDYTFNYAESTVANIYVNPLPKALSFTEAITILEQQTSLIFTILDNNLVSITPQSNITLCGYIIDSNTQEALAYATIQGEDAATSTNVDGFFSLDVSTKNEAITIRYLGYKTLVYPATKFMPKNCFTVELSTKSESLEEIVLTSFLVQGISKLNNGALSIDFDNFTTLPGLIETDVLQTVQALPGIQSANETISNITYEEVQMTRT